MERREQKNFENHLCGFRFLLVPATRASTEEDRRSSHTNDSRHEGDDGNESTPHTHTPPTVQRSERLQQPRGFAPCTEGRHPNAFGETRTPSYPWYSSRRLSSVGGCAKTLHNLPKQTHQHLVSCTPSGRERRSKCPNDKQQPSALARMRTSTNQPIKRSSLFSTTLQSGFADPRIYLPVSLQKLAKNLQPPRLHSTILSMTHSQRVAPFNQAPAKKMR